MHKIELQIPDIKFKVGDIVHFTEDNNVKGFDVTLRIDRIWLEGQWEAFSDQGSRIREELTTAMYIGTVQEGSKTRMGAPIRPGTMICPEISVLDVFGDTCEYKGTVWEPDTEDNIPQRREAWEALLAKKEEEDAAALVGESSGSVSGGCDSDQR